MAYEKDDKKPLPAGLPSLSRSPSSYLGESQRKDAESPSVSRDLLETSRAVQADPANAQVMLAQHEEPVSFVSRRRRPPCRAHRNSKEQQHTTRTDRMNERVPPLT